MRYRTYFLVIAILHQIGLIGQNLQAQTPNCTDHFGYYHASYLTYVFGYVRGYYPKSMEFLWDFGDGSTYRGSKTEHTYSKAGTYQACLTVKILGDSCTYCEAITVLPGSSSNCNTIGHVKDYSGLDGCGLVIETTDGLIEPTEVLPNFDLRDGQTIKFSYEKTDMASICMVGTTARITCINLIEDSATQKCQLDINYSKFELKPFMSRLPPLDPTYIFEAVNMRDSSCFWDFGDGSTAVGPFVEHAYLYPGVYTVTLINNLTDGQSCSTSKTAYFEGYEVEVPTNCTNEGVIADLPECGRVIIMEGGQIIRPTSQEYDVEDSLLYTLDSYMTKSSIDSLLECLTPPTSANDLYAYASGQRVKFGYEELYLAYNNFGYSCGAYAEITCLRADNDSTTQDCNAFIYYEQTVYPTLVPPAITAYSFNLEIPQEPSMVYWVFGDGSSEMGTTTTSHYYSKSGYYSICATIVSVNGQECTTCTHNYFEGNDQRIPECPTPSFEHATMESYPVKHGFYAETTSNPGIQYYWEFGDGLTSFSTKAVHVYEYSGTYEVCLTVTTANGCSNTICQSLYLEGKYKNKDCSPKPSYLLLFTPEQEFAGYYFKAGSKTNASNWFWNFGDGNVSFEQNPVHSYSNSGVYTVCLTTANTDDCNATQCVNLYAGNEQIIHQNTKNMIWDYNADGWQIRFSYLLDDVPEKLIWDFGDGSTTEGNIAEHNYFSDGPFNVNLTVITEAGATNYTQTINVNRTGGTSSLIDPTVQTSVELKTNPIVNGNLELILTENASNFTLRVQNTLGQNILTVPVIINNDNTISVALGNLSAGMYIATVEQTNGQLHSLPFVVK